MFFKYSDILLPLISLISAIFGFVLIYYWIRLGDKK